MPRFHRKAPVNVPVATELEGTIPADDPSDPVAGPSEASGKMVQDEM